MKTDAYSQAIRDELLRPELGADYRMRLKALAAVLNGEPISQVASSARVSVRTVRRWVAKVRAYGPAALDVSPASARKMVPDLHGHIVRDLERSPRDFGIEREHWGGNTLAHHLRTHYRVRISPRHCRRILRHAGIFNKRPQNPAPPAPSNSTHPLPPRSDSYRKQEALKRIRRLAVSALPTHTFVSALLELLEDAIPSGPNQAFLCGPGYSMASPRLVARGFDPARAMPAFQRFGPEAGPEISGVIWPPPTLSGTRPVLRHSQVTLPHFYRSAGYNEVFRPNRQHHLLSLGWLENGRADFRCTIWRSEQMKPFTEDDVRFAAAAAHHIRHGMIAARVSESPPIGPGEFAPLSRSVGLVYLDDRGHVRAMDSEAEKILREFGAFDGDAGDLSNFAADSSVFELIGRSLLALHSGRNAEAPGKPPYEMVQSSRSGLALKLRGIELAAPSGREQLAVMVELGEPRELMRRRLQLRYGLSPRQAEILGLIGRLPNADALAELLGVRPGTMRAHLRDLMERLELPGIGMLRKFARELLRSAE
jgi:transposase/DNA-binding CsgD family transcriptional regulator